jgi:hypothetical protein
MGLQAELQLPLALQDEENSTKRTMLVDKARSGGITGDEFKGRGAGQHTSNCS